MNKNVLKLALRGFAGCDGIPRSRKAKARLAAEFVEFVGTMNQPDRQDPAMDKYTTNSWEESEKKQTGTPWRSDQHDEQGFGVAKVASEKKAYAATKLAFLVLGKEQPDSVLEGQAREFLTMPSKAIVATSKRIKKLLASDDEDYVDSLEELTEAGEHEEESDDEEELDDMFEASEDEEDDIEESDDDEVLNLLYDKKVKTASKSKKGRKRVASKQKTVQKLGKVTMPESGSDEIKKLENLWVESGQMKKDWEKTGLFE